MLSEFMILSCLQSVQRHAVFRWSHCMRTYSRSLMEHILMRDVVSVWSVWSCCSSDCQIFVTPRCSPEIRRDAILKRVVCWYSQAVTTIVENGTNSIFLNEKIVILYNLIRFIFSIRLIIAFVHRIRRHSHSGSSSLTHPIEQI